MQTNSRKNAGFEAPGPVNPVEGKDLKATMTERFPAMEGADA